MRNGFRGRYIKNNINYRLRRIKKESRVSFLFTLFIALGAISGAVWAGETGASQSFITSFEAIFLNLRTGSLKKYDVFLQALIKYSFFFIAIWALPFFVKTSLPALFVLWLRGAGLGLTTRLLIMEYGAKGFLYAIAAYSLQNLILLPAYFLAFYNCMETLAFKKKREAAANFGVLLIGLALVVLSALIEVYIIPAIIRLFFL